MINLYVKLMQKENLNMCSVLTLSIQNGIIRALIWNIPFTILMGNEERVNTCNIQVQIFLSGV